MESAWSLKNFTNDDILALCAVAIVQLAGILAAAHAVLKKRDPRSAAGWCAVILLAPGLGPVLYWLFGINRIERKALKIYDQAHLQPQLVAELEVSPLKFPKRIKELMSLTSKVTRLPLSPNNRISPLINGEQAYPKMLSAIDEAEDSVVLSTFIFDNDKVGQRFSQALNKAAARGVKVRILIDDIGARYSFPTIFGKLKGPNLLAKRFHRVLRPWSYTYSQLRSHRKLLIVDGKIGFTGGMNIRSGHLVNTAKTKKKTQDMQFELEGPILKGLHEVFAQDWRFTTKGKLDISPPCPEQAGSTLARAIPSGPTESQGSLAWTLLGAVSVAESSIKIITPYFLPGQELVNALGAASLRGVDVQILLPKENNHVLAQWGSMDHVRQVLETGCKVFQSPPPFDHTKLMVVDGLWSLLGSGNWDARSLRLNFELNVECYDAELATRLSKIFKAKLSQAKALELEELDARHFAVKLRDGLTRLFTPYL